MLDPEDFVRPRLRGRLIALLSETPDAELHTRELARRTQTSPRAVQVAVEQLDRQGILRSRRVGSLRLWSLAPNNPLLRPLRELAKRTVGVPGRLRAALDAISGVELAFVYGSYALGTEDSASDIDVFVLGQPDWRSLAEQVMALREEFGREVNVVAWTEDQLQKSRQNPFYRTLRTSPKIWLKGKEGDLERRARRVARELPGSRPRVQTRKDRLAKQASSLAERNLERAERNLDSDPDQALINAETAIVNAADAVLAADGYRVRGKTRSHEARLHYPRLPKEFADEAAQVERARSLRSRAMYDQPESVSKAESAEMLRVARKLVEAVNQKLKQRSHR
jgi:predicted nucleotidyltransferase/uncharacterized protein (UPF0332 family)